MSELLTRRRFTVEEYHRMGEAGIFPEDNRLELIAGDIVVREPIGAYHAGTVDRLIRLWTSRVGDRAIVRVQNPVQFPREDSELQPDVMLLRPREDFYTTRHPEAADVLLLIEVADRTPVASRWATVTVPCGFSREASAFSPRRSQTLRSTSPIG